MRRRTRDEAMNESFVSIAAFTHLHEAQVALEYLKEVQISAFLAGEMTAGTFAGNAGLGPQVRLLVAKDDLKRAQDILASLRDHLAMPEGWEDDFPAEEGYWICSQC